MEKVRPEVERLVWAMEEVEQRMDQLPRTPEATCWNNSCPVATGITMSRERRVVDSCGNYAGLYPVKSDFTL